MPRKTGCGEAFLSALDSLFTWLSSSEPSTAVSPYYQSESPRYSVPPSFHPRVIEPQYRVAFHAPKPSSQYTTPSNSIKKPKAPKVSRSHKAGLQFPVGRISRYMKQGEYAERIGAIAPVYLAAVLEYLAAEILELAGNVAKENKKVRIIPRHIQIAVRDDEELNRMLGSPIDTSMSAAPSTRYEMYENE